MNTIAKLFCTGLLLMLSVSLLVSQTVTRKQVNVPKVDPVEITIDGVMDETAWSSAGEANLVTSAGFEMWMNAYGREGLAEPEYDEYYAKLLWAKDTLYAFIHIDEFVNDSTDLYWNGQWIGDQLFVSLSNRLGVEMEGSYDGNVYAAPDGPYHFLIMADSVTLNASALTHIPEEYRKFPDDTTRVFQASDIARWQAMINTTTGEWDIEMAIYNPHVNADSRVGFNIGGSTGSTANDTAAGDAYAYYTWQPSVIDEPFTQPEGLPYAEEFVDPGTYNLASSAPWALLEFVPGSGGPNSVTTRGNEVPERFVLSQNYPNPFNPETIINYDIPREARVTLTVYNILGQRVATLVDAVQRAGVYKATWDASHLSSGVYFYQLRVDNTIAGAKKMLLVK